MFCRSDAAVCQIVPRVTRPQQADRFHQHSLFPASLSLLSHPRRRRGCSPPSSSIDGAGCSGLGLHRRCRCPSPLSSSGGSAGRSGSAAAMDFSDVAGGRSPRCPRRPPTPPQWHSSVRWSQRAPRACGRRWRRSRAVTTTGAPHPLHVPLPNPPLPPWPAARDPNHIRGSSHGPPSPFP